jgi:AcrR family transcriptional regulator
MIHDSAATRRRLLDAATEEFGERGIAGARVARIASQAMANKEAIYSYFGSKQGLFEAAFEDCIKDFHRTVQFDENDLPEYAGRMFDKFEDAPNTRRMTLWYHLERSVDDPPLTIITESTGNELRRISHAQRDGRLPDFYPAEVLLGLIRSITLTWHTQVPELRGSIGFPRETKRAIVVAAVRWVLEEQREVDEVAAIRLSS